MPVVPLLDPKRTPPTGFALMALGFRPFFLLAGLGALMLMVAWLGLYGGGAAGVGHYGAVAWHAHEMVFGYTVAVMAGFLLTAARNWTGVATLQGGPLAALATLWLAARLLPFMPGVPGALTAAVDLAFLPLLALALYVPLRRVAQYRNYPFVVILLLIWLGDLLVQLELLGVISGWYGAALYATVDLILLVIVIMGGRVIPFFIERGLGGAVRTRQWPLADQVALAGVAALVVVDLFSAPAYLIAAVATVAAVANGLRLLGWHLTGLWRVPLLWVLFLGYAWLVLGLALKALAAGGLIIPTLALHAFTAGAIGALTLGMMPRVSIGHTGREMHAPRFLPTAFVLLHLGAAVRVLPPLAWPGAYVMWVMVAGTLWIAAFAIFVALFAPMLIRPRVDGLPG